MSAHHEFRLQNDLGAVPPLRERFSADCIASGVVEEERQSAMLAFTELVNNSIEHGCRGPADFIEGWWRITTTDIEVEVTDPGEVLTESDFKDADAGAFAEDGRGAGLFLIQALSDEVRVARAESGGTTVRIVKHRSRLGAAS